MKCNINWLTCSGFRDLRLAAWLGLLTWASCRPAAKPSSESGSTLPLDRISVVGASVSAGFGGTPFGDAFTVAAKGSKVDASANLMLFRDPIGDTKRQLDRAIAFGATTIVGLDLLFWDVYGSADQVWHDRALADALAHLEQARVNGTWIIIGDVPLITNASEMMLPKEAIPARAALDAANQTIRTWAAKERVLLVPLAEWTEPLRTGAAVEIAPNEKVEASSLMAIDGLHANPLGVWYVLDRLDHFIEQKLPGTPKDALVFVRPRN